MQIEYKVSFEERSATIEPGGRGFTGSGWLPDGPPVGLERINGFLESGPAVKGETFAAVFV